MSHDELAYYCRGLGDCGLNTFVHPCCASCPMGFSWSSYLAQSTLLAQLDQVGLTRSRMLADDLLPPHEGTVRFGLATDDVMIYDRAAPDVDSTTMAGHHYATELDRQLERAGIERHPKKDENGVASTTVIGIDVEDGATSHRKRTSCFCCSAVVCIC